MNPGMFGFVGQSSGGAIKSIQRGSISITGANLTATATITPVNTSKSELRFLGCSGTAANLSEFSVRVNLTNDTTITATRAANSSFTSIVSWELTEWA